MPVAAEPLLVGARALSLEQGEQLARHGRRIVLSEQARALIRKGRAALEDLILRGDQIYGVNTGGGGNIKFALSPDQAGRLQDTLMRHLSCATGQPLPVDVVRAAMLLRVATFATGAAAGRPRTGGGPGGVGLGRG